MNKSDLSQRRERIIQRIKDSVAIDPQTGCWNWQRGNSGNGRGGGYGRMWLDGQTVCVHIVVFTHFFGYKPKSRQIDHLCNNRRCCNPDHLDLVTQNENQQRRVLRQLKQEKENVRQKS